MYSRQIRRESKWLGLALLTCSTLLVSCGFPTKEDAQKMYSDYSVRKERSDKTDLLTSFLVRISNPRNREHFEVAEYTLEMLTDRFMESGDDAILEAVDRIEIDGGFANTVCTFYLSVKKHPSYQKRYSIQKYQPAVRRCIGLSFSEDEFP